MATVRFEWYAGPSIQSGAITQAPMLDARTTATTIDTTSTTSVVAPAWATLVFVVADDAVKLSVSDTTPTGTDVPELAANEARFFGVRGGTTIYTNNP